MGGVGTGRLESAKRGPDSKSPPHPAMPAPCGPPQVERHVRDRVASAFDRSPAQGAGSELGAILAGLKLLLVRGDEDAAPAPAASGGGGGGYRAGPAGSSGGGGLARGGKQRPEVAEFLAACRRMGAWQEEVRHVRDVEARLRQDLEEARQAAAEGRAAMRREMQVPARRRACGCEREACPCRGVLFG